MHFSFSHRKGRAYGQKNICASALILLLFKNLYEVQKLTENMLLVHPEMVKKINLTKIGFILVVFLILRVLHNLMVNFFPSVLTSNVGIQ